MGARKSISLQGVASRDCCANSSAGRLANQAPNKLLSEVVRALARAAAREDHRNAVEAELKQSINGGCDEANSDIRKVLD